MILNFSLSTSLSIQAKLSLTEAQMAFRKEKIKEMMHEARLMRQYDHDNIVRIYGVAVDREPLMIIIELVNIYNQLMSYAVSKVSFRFKIKNP